MPFKARVPIVEYIIAVNLAPSSLSEPKDRRLPMTGPLRARSAALLSGMLSTTLGFRSATRQTLWYERTSGQGRRSAKNGQAEWMMSCELVLLSGRPCDQPGCAASANP